MSEGNLEGRTDSSLSSFDRLLGDHSERRKRAEPATQTSEGIDADAPSGGRTSRRSFMAGLGASAISGGSVVAGQEWDEPADDSFANEPFANDPFTNDSITITSFVDVSDDTDTIRVRLPESWRERDGQPSETDVARLTVASDIDDFLETYATPGILIRYGSEAQIDNLDVLLGRVIPDRVDACVDGGVYTFQTNALSGRMHEFRTCAEAQSTNRFGAARPTDGVGVVFLFTQLVTESDIESFTDVILPSIRIAAVATEPDDAPGEAQSNDYFQKLVTTLPGAGDSGASEDDDCSGERIPSRVHRSDSVH